MSERAALLPKISLPTSKVAARQIQIENHPFCGWGVYSMEEVTLVDENGCAVGVAEKLQAHLEGKLHRAFSIFVFDGNERLLLQQRAKTKYHSAGLWSNTCCGHPRPGESVREAALRRLEEEMGFRCDLREVFTFFYRIELENRFIEHELDHVLVGHFSDALGMEIVPRPAEVEDWKWLNFNELNAEIKARPERFTYWLKLAISKGVWQEINGGENS